MTEPRKDTGNEKVDERSFVVLLDTADSCLSTIDKHIYIARKADEDERSNSVAKDTLADIVACLENAESLSYELRENLYDKN